jgi:hypothetical protein
MASPARFWGIPSLFEHPWRRLGLLSGSDLNVAMSCMILAFRKRFAEWDAALP